MLNIKDLEEKFDAMLNALNKADLEIWQSFYQHRKTLEKLRQGKTVTIDFIVPAVINIEQISINPSSAQYNSTPNTQCAMAA